MKAAFCANIALQGEQEHKSRSLISGQPGRDLRGCSVQLICKPCSGGTGCRGADADIFRRWKEAGMVVMGMEKSWAGLKFSLELFIDSDREDLGRTF